MAFGQGGTNFWDGASPISHAFCDESGNFTLVKCTAANIPSGVSGYAYGCGLLATDTGNQYVNTGGTTACTFTLLDTALGGAATSLVDSSQLNVVTTVHTASAVNYLTVGNSAAGAVSANAIVLVPAGSDSAISLTLKPLGATGILNFGSTTQTGVINVGLSTTATTAGVNILSAASTASTQTIEIGGGTSTTSGGKVVNIANGVPGASTTNTVAIGTGGTTTGTVGVTIGSNGNAAHTTTIQGGSGAAITLTPQTTGAILIGAAAGTGAITVGSSSTTQTLNLGSGGGVATINVGTGVAANVIKIGAASSLTTLYGTLTSSLESNRVTAGGSNNAITGVLTDAAGVAIATATGLRITCIMGALTLQAGGNTLNLNSTSAIAIKKASAPTVDIAVARAANAVVELVFNGTSWLALSE